MKNFRLLLLVGVAVSAGVAGCNGNASESATPVAISGNAVPAPSASAVSPSTSAALAGDDQSQIAQAIQTHLADNKGINMGAMDMTVKPATITGDQAQATAEFRPKNGQGSMEVNYVLQRHAGGWIVTSSAPAGGQFEHPPMDKAHSGSQMGQPPSGNHSQFPDFSDYLKKKDSQSSARQ